MGVAIIAVLALCLIMVRGLTVTHPPEFARTFSTNLFHYGAAPFVWMPEELDIVVTGPNTFCDLETNPASVRNAIVVTLLATTGTCPTQLRILRAQAAGASAFVFASADEVEWQQLPTTIHIERIHLEDYNVLDRYASAAPHRRLLGSVGVEADPGLDVPW